MNENYNNNYNNIDNNNVVNNNYDDKKKKNLLPMIIGGVLVVGVIILVVLMFSKKSDLSSNNGETNTGSNVSSSDVYYDSSRNLKSEYTFEEVTEKFAFVVENTTLKFEKNNKVSMLLIVFPDKKESNIQDARFYYDCSDENYNSGGDIGTINVGESNANNFQEFIDNFKNGKLNEKTIKEVQNVEIIETTDDYVLGSWTVGEDYEKLYEYYFAKKIGNTIYYVYRSSVIDEKQDIDILVKEFKSLFSCLSEDDKKEPYIYDKVINTPAVTNQKKISYKDIFSVDSQKVNFN